MLFVDCCVLFVVLCCVVRSLFVCCLLACLFVVCWLMLVVCYLVVAC